VDWKPTEAIPRITLLRPTYIGVENALIDYFVEILVQSGLLQEEPPTPPDPPAPAP